MFTNHGLNLSVGTQIEPNHNRQFRFGFFKTIKLKFQTKPRSGEQHPHLKTKTKINEVHFNVAILVKIQDKTLNVTNQL